MFSTVMMHGALDTQGNKAEQSGMMIAGPFAKTEGCPGDDTEGCSAWFTPEAICTWHVSRLYRGVQASALTAPFTRQSSGSIGRASVAQGLADLKQLANSSPAYN